MRIECPGCKYAGDVPEEKIPEQGASINCPKCKTKFQINRPAPASPVQPSQNNNTLPPQTKPCRFCGEEILAVAIKCKHCESIVEDIKENTKKNNISEHIPLSKLEMFLVVIFGFSVLISFFEKSPAAPSIFIIYAGFVTYRLRKKFTKNILGQKWNEKLKLTWFEIVGLIFFVQAPLHSNPGYNTSWSLCIFFSFCFAIIINRILVAKYKFKPVYAVLFSTVMLSIMLVVGFNTIPITELPKTTLKPSVSTNSEKPPTADEYEISSKRARQTAKECNIPDEIAEKMIARMRAKYTKYASAIEQNMLSESKKYVKIQEYIEKSKNDSKLAIIVADAEKKYPYYYEEQLKYIEETVNPQLAIDRENKKKEDEIRINNLIAQKQLEAMDAAKSKEPEVVKPKSSTSLFGISERKYYKLCQESVKSGLKAPSTAKFPSYSDVKVVANNDREMALFFPVDAQNGFGAMIRSNCTCIVNTKIDSVDAACPY